MVDPPIDDRPIGCIIGQRLCAALAGKVGIDFKELERLVYSQLSEIAAEQDVGDWLEFPNGTSYTMEFKPQA